MDSDHVKSVSKETKNEVKWWAYAAWTTPFAALAGLFFINVLGWDSLYHKTLIVGAVVMFSTSVFWWWWAINKIATLADIMGQTAKNFDAIKQQLRKFRQDMGDR